MTSDRNQTLIRMVNLGLDEKAIKLAVEALLEILQVSGKNMELGKSNHFSWLLLWFLMPKLMPITYCFKQKAQGLNRPAPSNLYPSYLYFLSV